MKHKQGMIVPSQAHSYLIYIVYLFHMHFDLVTVRLWSDFQSVRAIL